VLIIEIAVETGALKIGRIYLYKKSENSDKKLANY